LKPYKTTYTDSGYALSAAEFIKMKQRLEKLEQKVEVLQKVDCTVSSPLKEKLRELSLLYGQYSVHVLCEALEVPRGTFYNHIFRNKGDNSSYQIRRTQLSERIKQIYEESNQIFGAKKIKAVLEDQGEAVSDKMVAELMQEMNLYSIRTGAKKYHTRFNYEKKKDSLKMNFSAKAPNQVWVSDVTCFKLDDKFQYICVIIDLFSRKVIAYKISQKHSTQLITSTFKLAYAERKPEDGLIFHSDRGLQYTSHAFQKLSKAFHIKQSFSPSGRPHHNAVMESFFSSMKKEELYRTNFHSVGEFKQRIKKYIEFYNMERPHATLAYKTPNTYERLFCNKQERKAN
jgi:transposase InsO family protein/tetrahydromethanopterin S-methyltransferase subunit G